MYSIGRYIVKNQLNLRQLLPKYTSIANITTFKDKFVNRHIGINENEINTMLNTLNLKVTLFKYKGSYSISILLVVSVIVYTTNEIVIL